MAGYLRNDAVPAADVAAYGARYQPPQGNELLAAVEKLMAFGWSGDLAPVERVAIAHGELMLLWPFQVGNIEVAQLLTSVLLEKWAMILPVLDLNGILRQRRIECDQRLKAVAARNDWRNWIEFFQSCVADGAEASADVIFEVTRLVAERRDRLVSNKKTKHACRATRGAVAISSSHHGKLCCETLRCLGAYSQERDRDFDSLQHFERNYQTTARSGVCGHRRSGNSHC